DGGEEPAAQVLFRDHRHGQAVHGDAGARGVNKHHAPDLKAERISGSVATDRRHDSAHKHVAGQAVYIDDMPEPAGLLHACLGLSTVAHGRIVAMDLAAVRAAPGVVDV